MLVQLVFAFLLQDAGTPQTPADAPGGAIPIAVSRLPWAQRPVIEYPERAAMNRVGSGEVTLDCAVNLDGALTDCIVVSETPSEQSFGLVAVAGMRRARLDLAQWSEARVTFTIGFVMR